MGWRSIMISKGADLRLKHGQLKICRQDKAPITLPLEDIDSMVLDTAQTRLSGQLLSACMEQQSAVYVCDKKHMPAGVLLPFNSHHRGLKVLRRQLNMGKPLRKRLWQQLVQAKINNQSELLLRQKHATQARMLTRMASKVRSGDPDNIEAPAAAAYFRVLFGQGFARRKPVWINSALNYSYCLIRGLIARSLVGSGYQPALGLGHNNEQNAFNLADDLLEPWRAIVDGWVIRLMQEMDDDDQSTDLLPAHKQQLVANLTAEVILQGDCYGVSAAANEQVNSLSRAIKCKDTRLLLHPEALQHDLNDGQ